MTVLETKGLEKECSYLSKERPSKMKSYDIALFHIISECGHAYLDMECILTSCICLWRLLKSIQPTTLGGKCQGKDSDVEDPHWTSDFALQPILWLEDSATITNQH